MRDQAIQIIDFVKANGASEALMVGGCVRDQILGFTPKDIDCEVYGLPLPQLQAILSRRFKVKAVGESFGVLKVGADGHELDVSVPRRENKVGVGHKGFDVQTDHNMTPFDAALRRDFTINAIMQDRDGNIIDPHGGIKDLGVGKSVVLRAVSDAFAEDPLRVLRGMQFASRFNGIMDARTVAMCIALKGEFVTLAKERVFEEWRKWAKGKFPARGLEVLVLTQWIEHFSMLKALIGCPQDSLWHPEGPVWDHTCYVCDAAAEIADRDGLTGEYREELLFSALAHDFGKPETTVQTEVSNPDGSKSLRWTAHGHDSAGVPHAKSFLELIGAFGPILESVPQLVEEHMAHASLDGQALTPRIVRRLANRLHPASLEMWGRLVEADHNGRPPLPKGSPVLDFLEVGKSLNVLSDKPEPILMGRHLLGLGLLSGPKIGQITKTAFEKQLDGEFSDVDGAIAWCKGAGLL